MHWQAQSNRWIILLITSKLGEFRKVALRAHIPCRNSIPSAFRTGLRKIRGPQAPRTHSTCVPQQVRNAARLASIAEVHEFRPAPVLGYDSISVGTSEEQSTGTKVRSVREPE